MKTMYKALALGFAPLTLAALSLSPALAQSKLGVAVASVDKAVADSTAYTTAMSQMKVTYKANFDTIAARKAALEAELKQKGDALQAAVKAAGGKITPALQPQVEAYQKRNTEAQQEMQKLSQPLQIANAYVEAQIGAKIKDALTASMAKAKVDVLLAPDATVSYAPSVDITPMVTAEINALVPNVSIVPPAGWQPGQPVTPATNAPAGR